MVAVAVLVAAPAPPVTSSPAADPLGCEATLFDPDGVLDRGEVEAAIDRAASGLGADVRVRVERSLDAGLDARMEQLEQQCAGWEVAGDRAPDLVVVMYSSVEREAAVYYGAEQGPQLEERWEPAVDAMIPWLRRGDFTGGVVEGLEGLGSPTFDAFAPIPTVDEETGGGWDGANTAVVLFVLALAAVAMVTVWHFARTGEWDAGGSDWGNDDDSSSGWGSRSSRSRSRSFSSSGRSGRSSSRSSGGSRRSGGGSKRW